jgi:tetratricopeptide (TPR) repeat protein
MLEHQLGIAHQLVESGEYTEALPVLEDILEEYPNQSAALNMLGFCWSELGKDATAYQFFTRALQTQPDNEFVLVNAGRSLHELGHYQKALDHYLKAAKLNPEYAMAYANAAATLVQMSKWEDGIKCAQMALDCDPNEKNSQMNLASCYLATGELGKGWDAMELSLGGKFRKEWSYGDEPRWDGSKDKTLVIYGEQGLGDEIYFMECANEVIADSKEVHIDCDPRLEKLFARSFPNAHVHGTRRDDSVTWLEGLSIDARTAMASMQRFYRRTSASYKNKPYLVADPDLRKMWRALFDSFGKPVVGVCSRSGTKRNNEAGRTITEDDWKPLIETHDAVYVSLDYKGDDPSFTKSYHFATRSNDYDDTAALIAELDCVVGVCTTAIHCADALGVPTYILVPDCHNFKFAGGIPFYPTQTLCHQNQKTWEECIRRIHLDL